MSIWVVYDDYGYDGCSEPIIAFKTEFAALKYMADHQKGRCDLKRINIELQEG